MWRERPYGQEGKGIKETRNLVAEWAVSRSSGSLPCDLDDPSMPSLTSVPSNIAIVFVEDSRRVGFVEESFVGSSVIRNGQGGQRQLLMQSA